MFAKRESAITVWYLAFLLILVGALLRPFPAVGVGLVGLAHLLAIVFWARYAFSPCPRCAARFLSAWSILFLALPRADRCCHCPPCQCHLRQLPLPNY
jgi:hypothetical protein